MSKFSGIEFRCECCRGVFYRLTDKFVPEPPMRGDYVELLPKYGPGGYNWYDFPHTECTIGDNVFCVQCGEPIRMSHVMTEVGRIYELQAMAEKEKIIASAPVCETEEDNEAADDVLVTDHIDNNACADSNDDPGLYDNPEIEDTLLSTVLKMMADGATQAAIAETCGISVYRVRKFQNGELE